MKNIKLLFILTILLVFASYTQGQTIQQMLVHSHGDILINTNLSGSDTITFSRFTVPNNATGVLINGVVWATCNVNKPGEFASHPSEAGMFYQWNRKVGWSSTDPLVNHEGGTTWDDSTPEGDTWEKENDPCPTGWRVPNLVEIESLANSGSFWGELNGVSGLFFGNSDQRVFLFAAGYRSYGGLLYHTGKYGYYWSSTSYNSEEASRLIFGSKAAGIGGTSSRPDGHSVRCVLE